MTNTASARFPFNEIRPEIFPSAFVVTGSGTGIGRECALALGRMEQPVLCLGKNTDSVQETAERVHMLGGKADALTVDIRDLSTVSKAVRGWIARKATAGVGVVLAAADFDRGAEPVFGDMNDWARVFETNVVGNLNVVAACWPAMELARSGRIVFFAGGGAAYAFPAAPAYAASKAATVRVAETLGWNASRGVSVVCLAPGAHDTALGRHIQARGGPAISNVSMHEVTGFVTAFMTSPHAQLINGRYVHVRDQWQPTLHYGLPPDAQKWLLRRNE